MEYCPFCDSELELTLRKNDKWYCRNCNKYFIQVVDEDEPASEPSRRAVYSKGRVAAVWFVIIMMIIGIIICGYLTIPA